MIKDCRCKCHKETTAKAREIAYELRIRICELLNHQVYSKTDTSNCKAVEEEIAAALREYGAQRGAR